MNERGLKNRFHKWLKELVLAGAPLAFHKNHGTKFSGAHEPDYTGCAKGQFWAIELKNPSEKLSLKKVTPGQIGRLREYERAGARVLVTNDLARAQKHVSDLLVNGSKESKQNVP